MKNYNSLSVLCMVMIARDPVQTTKDLQGFLEQLTTCVTDANFVSRYRQLTATFESNSDLAGRTYQSRVNTAEATYSDATEAAESLYQETTEAAEETYRRAVEAAEKLGYQAKSAATSKAYQAKSAATSKAYQAKSAATSSAYQSKETALNEAHFHRDNALGILLEDHGVIIPEDPEVFQRERMMASTKERPYQKFGEFLENASPFWRLVTFFWIWGGKQKA